jgi:hypothetical protein
MKKITGSLLLYLIISQTQTIAGQTNGNTIVLPNSSWSVLKYRLLPHPYTSVSTQYIYFDGDSIAAGKTYKKVFSCDDKLHENTTYEGLIREQDKKTFFIRENFETEYLLYDFSLEEGTNFEYQSTIRYVKKVDFVEINGIQKKRIQLTSPPPYDDRVDAIWIEGIGSLTGLFSPCSGMHAPNNTLETLLCYLQDNEAVYKYPTLSGCYYDNAEDIIYEGGIFYEKKDITSMESKITNDLTVYPNPVDNILVISSSNAAVSFAEFTGVSGETVYAKRLDANKENKIDMGRFAPGSYLLHVYDTNGLVSTAKIIKR